jgi:4-amino-4-deoxy-L-arabinose transferase-like glycosyltransferase
LLFYYILLALSLVGHTFGMFNNILEIDAMQYASMSREILRNENFIFLFDNGKPYLDKPPLIFWVTSLIFKVFGA